MGLLSKSFISSMRPPTIRNAADWADAHAYLSGGDANEGKFRCRTYQRDILRAMSIGSRMQANGAPIKEVVFLKSAQVGFSICILHAIAYTILHRPTNIGHYMPSRDSSEAWASNQATKYWSAQPALEGVISSESKSDGKSSALRKHFPGGTLRFLSSNKATDLASHSLGLILCDELDEFKDSKKEGSVLDLIRNRGREFANGIIVWGGTPRGTFQTSKTWNLYEDSNQMRFYIRCPKCGKLQYLALPQFEIGESDFNDSGFRCINQSCNYLIKDREKYELLKHGIWKPTNPEGIPGRAGFAINAFYSDAPTCSWPLLARMKADAGFDKPKLMSFLNTFAGLPTSPTDFGQLKAQDILDNTPNSPYSTVTGHSDLPNDICLLTAGVDVQGPGKDARLEFSLYGWSRTKCWFLTHMSLDGNIMESQVWSDMDSILNRPYTTADKKKRLKPALIFVDSGNGASAKTVYRECRRLGRIYAATKGHINPSKPITTRSNVPNTAQPLILIQTALTKDRIMMMLKSFVHGDPDAELHLPSDLDAYVAAGLTSEYRTTRPGNPPKVSYTHNKVDRNEPLDCFSMAFAAKEFHTGQYAPDTIWPQLEKKAAIAPQTERKTLNHRPNVDFGGFY